MAVIAEVCLRLGFTDIMEFYRMPAATQDLYVNHQANLMMGAYTASAERAPESEADRARKAAEAWQLLTGRGA